MTPRAPLPMVWLTAFAAALLLLLGVVAWRLLDRAAAPATGLPEAAAVDAPSGSAITVDDADAGAPGGFAPALAAGPARAAAAPVASASPAPLPLEPLPEPGLPLAEIWDALAERADRGDAFAACRISTELVRCRLQALNKRLGVCNEQPRPGDSAATRESIASQHRWCNSLERICSSVTREMQENAYRYQVIAAERGTARMRLALAVQPALDTRRFLTDLDEWNDYRARLLPYLHESLRLGDPFALTALTAIYYPSVTAISPPLHIDDDWLLLLYHTLGQRVGVLRRLPMDEELEALRASLDPQRRQRVDRAADELYRRHFRDSPVLRRDRPALSAQGSPEHVCREE